MKRLTKLVMASLPGILTALSFSGCAVLSGKDADNLIYRIDDTHRRLKKMEDANAEFQASVSKSLSVGGVCPGPIKRCAKYASASDETIRSRISAGSCWPWQCRAVSSGTMRPPCAAAERSTVSRERRSRRAASGSSR